jgi:hypothetical protein
MVDARNKGPNKSALKRRIKEPGASRSPRKRRKSKAEPNEKMWPASFEEFEVRLAAQEPHVAAIYRFDVECPAEFGALKTLLSRTLSKEISTDRLKIRIGGIIYSGRRLHKDEEYKKILVNVIRNAYAAERLIESIYNQMRLIDDDYLEGCLDHVELSLSDEDKKCFYSISPPDHEGSVPMLIRFTKLAMQGLSGILSDITGNPERGKVRGHPSIPYVEETMRLMDVWRDITGQDAVWPKGSAPGTGGETVSTQPSTEFIRLCLKMIDPEITLSNTQTCIKKARELKKKLFG